MSKFINTLKTIDRTIIIASVLMFAAGLIVGQQTTSRETKKHYIVDASEADESEADEADAEFIRQMISKFDAE